jgi:hypothetical protein
MKATVNAIAAWARNKKALAESAGTHDSNPHMIHSKAYHDANPITPAIDSRFVYNIESIAGVKPLARGLLTGFLRFGLI